MIEDDKGPVPENLPNPFIPDPSYIDPTNISELRRQAYQNESDPIYFMWSRDEATKQDWLDKIQEIKTRYPNPE